MSEVFEVREYETIAGNSEYENQYKCMDKDSFADLLKFVRAFNSHNEKNVKKIFGRVNWKVSADVQTSG